MTLLGSKRALREVRAEHIDRLRIVTTAIVINCMNGQFVRRLPVRRRLDFAYAANGMFDGLHRTAAPETSSERRLWAVSAEATRIQMSEHAALHPRSAMSPIFPDAALCTNDSYRGLDRLLDQAVRRRAFMLILHLSHETPATAMLSQRRQLERSIKYS